ncbi:HIT-like protein [Rickettsiales endosymbiont of Paramecium tredecaurelia]|uniref:HIT domain-containing protein n=1 Tax=Candidatus Sarmatiella mevalonica TaxID=2770581 RepID=UPI00192454E3|nr:HIT domain-containing protein [Candidatus Sarmatiella mevalonica]MBL3284768.1 HIT-like protein [Candidatus Sarmatiella mevalonica]
MYDDKNPFAKILRNELPVEKIYEDQFVLAFKDIAPVAPTHILVIPKKYVADYQEFIEQATEIEIVSYFKAITHIVDMLELDSYRLITNKGYKSGQSVFHFHTHIISGSHITNLI